MDYVLSFINANAIKGVILAMLIAGIKTARPYIVEAFNQGIALLKSKVEASQYAQQYIVALSIWNQVEEDFRIEATITETFQSKAEYFDSLLLKKFPSLTQDDIDSLRQAIAGEENANK